MELAGDQTLDANVVGTRPKNVDVGVDIRHATTNGRYRRLGRDTRLASSSLAHRMTCKTLALAAVTHSDCCKSALSRAVHSLMARSIWGGTSEYLIQATPRF